MLCRIEKHTQLLSVYKTFFGDMACPPASSMTVLADVLQETAALLGITQLPTSGGHPQTDRLVEHFNRTLKQMLKKLVNKKGHNWENCHYLLIPLFDRLVSILYIV